MIFELSGVYCESAQLLREAIRNGGVATTPFSRASSGRGAEFIPPTAGHPRLRVKIPSDGIEWV